MRQFDVIVIGAGQAGLAAGYYLKKKGVSFALLDRAREVGESWSNRYDSLTLFTPRFYSGLPGLPLEGDQQGNAAKDEIASYLKRYAEHFELPVHLDTGIVSLTRAPSGFDVRTTRGTYAARNVIVATGPFQQPIVPTMAERLDADVRQLHSAEYRNPAQLNDGSVLVVGAGNSGAQIAVELADGRDVYLSAGHPLRFMPLRLMGKSIFWWFDKLGVLHANTDSSIGRIVRKRPDPIFGHELRVKLKTGSIVLKPEAVSAVGNEVAFADRTAVAIDNIVWATGFRSDYSWIDIPGVIGAEGKPVHRRGVGAVPGLYFVGLPWQYRRGSALIGGVHEDAEFIVKHM